MQWATNIFTSQCQHYCVSFIVHGWYTFVTEFFMLLYEILLIQRLIIVRLSILRKDINILQQGHQIICWVSGRYLCLIQCNASRLLASCHTFISTFSDSVIHKGSIDYRSFKVKCSSLIYQDHLIIKKNSKHIIFS